VRFVKREKQQRGIMAREYARNAGEN